MSRAAIPVDLATLTLAELERVIEEVRRSRTPRLLRRGQEDLALLTPARHVRRRRRGARHVSRRRAGIGDGFGGWKGLVDADELKRQRRALQVHEQPSAAP